FEAMDDKVDLADSAFLAGNDGPTRTPPIVVRQDARLAATVPWSFARPPSSATASNVRRNARPEPDQPP
ncbi:hypothetical protein QU41_00135, partial [Bradyrhizobium elkanii]